MEARSSWWQKARKPLAVFGIVLACILIIALLAVIVMVYVFNVNVPGLRGKTLWDWMQLLIVPIVLAVGGFLFSITLSRNEQKSVQQRDKTAQEIAFNNRCDATLQEYLDKMTELLLKENLRKSEADAEVRIIAHVRTLTVLEELDPTRRSILLQFLIISNLIQNEPKNSIIDMYGANLMHTDLRFLTINGVNLRRVRLNEANLEHASFRGTNLSRARLVKADLSEADLSEADLSEAILYRANLNGANLTRANLYNAFLARAKLCGTRLNYADLREVTLSGYGQNQANDLKYGGADLRGADLRGADLRYSYMSGANLSGANTNLSGAELEGANLSDSYLYVAYQRRIFIFEASSFYKFLYFLDFINKAILFFFWVFSEENATLGANLSGTNLSGANLRRTYLRKVDLSGANLSKANLSYADLSGANLSGADLSNAIVTPKQLDKAKSLKGATMPNGSIHP